MRLRHGGFIFTESAPVVVVFTKYDRAVRSMQIELNIDQDTPVSDDLVNAGAQKVLDDCIQSLKTAEARLGIQKLNYAKFSSMISHSFAD
jgi:hypothetical protein